MSEKGSLVERPPGYGYPEPECDEGALAEGSGAPKERCVEEKAEEKQEYPGPWSVAAIMAALCFATFLIALVRVPFSPSNTGVERVEC